MTPVGGTWSYAPTATGSAARFIGSTGLTQLTLTCVRASRQISIARPAAAAAPFLTVWTSFESRNIPASFNPATNLLAGNLHAYEGLFDALSFSRGRIAVAVSGQPALVLPPWPEMVRVIEDCRA